MGFLRLSCKNILNPKLNVFERKKGEREKQGERGRKGERKTTHLDLGNR